MSRKTRRGHGEGGIYQRNDGRWAGMLDLPPGPDGKRKRKYVYGKTRKEVAEKLRKLRADLDAGLLATPDRLTLGELVTRWLDDVAAHRVRPVTLDSYRRYANVHIQPALGTIPLKKMQPMHLQRLYSEMAKAGKAPRTIRYVHTIVRAALTQAVRWQLLARNPADAVEPPGKQRKETHTLTRQETVQLLQAAADDRYYALYYLALATGMRRAELLALRWADLDLKRATVQVRRSLEWVKDDQRVSDDQPAFKAVFTEPKTSMGRRNITLPTGAVTALKAHRKRQQEERLRAGPHYQDHDLVFCLPDGSPVPPYEVSRKLGNILKGAGLPPVRFHDLRHTHATLLLEQGVHPKVVSERLGHSSITVTMDIYSHVSQNMQAQVARQVDDLLSGK